MKNLAGNKVCDAYIEEELRLAKIPACWCLDQQGEVPASIIGKIGGFIFTRAWTYWIVKGDLPLGVALELYADPIGEDSIRVSGHCGKPSPEGLARIKNGVSFVDCYHIDTMEGLRLFADTLKKYGLVK